MVILLILIPLAFCLGLAALAAFIWALNNGQFEDLEGHASRILQPDPADDVTLEPRPEPTLRP